MSKLLNNTISTSFCCNFHTSVFIVHWHYVVCVFSMFLEPFCDCTHFTLYYTNMLMTKHFITHASVLNFLCVCVTHASVPNFLCVLGKYCLQSDTFQQHMALASSFFSSSYLIKTQEFLFHGSQGFSAELWLLG